MSVIDMPGLNRMKKIEVVVHASEHRLVEAIFDDAGISGWTMIRDVAGMGHDGFHQGRTIFSDESGLLMFVGVGPTERVRRAADGLRELFASHAGVLFLSDVEVMRSDYFTTA